VPGHEIRLRCSDGWYHLDMLSLRAGLSAALAAIISLVPGPAPAAALDKAGFTEAYAAWLRKALPDAKVEVAGSLHLRFKVKGEQTADSFLDNAWRDYERSPGDLQAILDRYGGANVEGARGSGKRIDPSRIVPVIKDRGWLEEARRGLATSGVKSPEKADGVFEDYNGVLVIFYAEDREKGIAYLTEDQLASTGIARTKLRAIAVQNLGAIIPEVNLRGGNGTYMVTAGGNYEASLLLSDGLWKQLAGKVTGELVVAVPSRDVLLVTGSQDAGGLAKVRGTARDIVGKGNYALTEQLFIRRGGKFMPWNGKP